MRQGWPSLQTLELFVAIVDGGSVGAGARTVGIAQPNASRLMADLERAAGANLLERSPHGSAPTAAGLVLADRARELLNAATHFNETAWTTASAAAATLRVGASQTIAEQLLPAWLSTLRRQRWKLRADLRVLNSEQVIDQVRNGDLQLGFVESPQLPVRLNALVIHEDELVVVVAPDHPWAERRAKVGIEELAHTALVVREPGSGTREALDELLAEHTPVEPAQVAHSNAAVRVAVAAGDAPAALSQLAVRDQLAHGELLQVPLESDITRPLTAIWAGPRRLAGAAAALVSVAQHATR